MKTTRWFRALRLGGGLSLLLLSSCATLFYSAPPGAVSLEAGGALLLAEAESPLPWNRLGPGVDTLFFIAEDPPLALYAVRADLSRPEVDVVLTPPAEEGFSHEMEGLRTSLFWEENRCVAAVNGPPFEPYRWFSRRGQDVSGLYIWEGELISPPRPEYHALLIYASGRGEIVSQAPLDKTLPEPIPRFAVGGFFPVLTRGVVTLPPPEATSVPGPVTAAGLSSDGTILYLLVVDGRRPGHSLGVTPEEAGMWMRRLGAWNALTLDGGGSTTLVLPDAEGHPRVINRPVNRRGTSERIVAAHLGIALDADFRENSLKRGDQ